MELGHNEETDARSWESLKSQKKSGLFDMIVPVLTLMTIVNCVVILVLVMNIGRKVNGLEQRVQLLQDRAVSVAAQIQESEPADAPVYADVSDIDGNAVDAAEAADIVEAAALEDTHKEDVERTNSSGIRRVYLTFDDGPSANTDRILDILNQYGVKATFFVVGKDGYADQYRRIVEDGHTLAMHSYSHKYSEIYASVDAYSEDLTKLHDFLYELTGVDCSIVRFPGGSSNTISRVDMRELIAYLNREQMAYFDWNVSSGDATGTRTSANQIARNVLSTLDQFDNAVILFHDAAGKDTTVDALPAIIEKILESDNTVILPISEDTARVQHLHE
ncbi:MAG: polysaccharide deacetylase [Lachnospiraceae bacterium]|nr:polysaccharide deacetylase [Lachnospiraceae bacterium]MDE7028693.1 polysaccharide deacetylase [Lachnospiraceae bacterium]